LHFCVAPIALFSALLFFFRGITSQVFDSFRVIFSTFFSFNSCMFEYY
jgi:hypothetical protein